MRGINGGRRAGGKIVALGEVKRATMGCGKALSVRELRHYERNSHQEQQLGNSLNEEYVKI